MKKFNPGAIVASVAILICACISGAMSVSALTINGDEFLSGLVSVGTSLGIDIGDYVSTETTTEKQTSAPGSEDDLSSFLTGLGVKLDVQFVTDLITFLSSERTFADWVYTEYGDSVEIPESVRTMSTNEVIMFLLGAALYPTESAATTNGDYVFVPSETQSAGETTTRKPHSETETRSTIIIIPPDEETEVKRRTGDVNADGRITAADARKILRAAAGLDKLTGAAADAADVNGDSVITAKDARSVLRFAAGITTSF